MLLKPERQGSTMQHKIISAFVYGSSTVGLWLFFDALFGAGPVTSRIALIRLGVAGAMLVGVACILSLFSLRLALLSALTGLALLWPYFFLLIVITPWAQFFVLVSYGHWKHHFIGIFSLIIATAYSITRLVATFGKHQIA